MTLPQDPSACVTIVCGLNVHEINAALTTTLIPDLHVQSQPASSSSKEGSQFHRGCSPELGGCHWLKCPTKAKEFFGLVLSQVLKSPRLSSRSLVAVIKTSFWIAVKESRTSWKMMHRCFVFLMVFSSIRTPLDRISLQVPWLSSSIIGDIYPLLTLRSLL